MRITAWIVAAAGTLFLVLLAALFLVDRAVGHVPMPSGAFNRSVRSDLSRNYRTSVAILGDSQKGLASLANLVRAVQEENVCAAFHTGDLVSHNDQGHYRLAALALVRGGLKVPLRVVPGNHDVKRGDDRFRRELGDIGFVFMVGRAAFIGLDNSSGAPPDLAMLRSMASTYRDRELILLMHVPPFDVEGKTRPGYEPFVAWLETSRVRYVFAGHVHDYVRREIGKTVVIANGVGGDYESWQLDQKVYGTILDIDGLKLSDRAIVLPPDHGFWWNVEHFAVGHVAEEYRTRPFACWSASFALGGLTILAILYLRRKAG